MNNTWDPATYDGSFGFVTALGAELLDKLRLPTGSRVLDVGCGTGVQAAELTKRGLRVVGIDSDERMIASASMDYPEVEFVSLDAEAFGLADLGGRPFHAALSNAALHWMNDQDAVLANVRSCLLDGSPFVAEMGGEHNIATVDRALRDALRTLDLDIPVVSNYFPSVGEQSIRLEAAGFRVESMRWFRRPTPLPAGQTAADWTRHFRANVWRQVSEDVQPRLGMAVDDQAQALKTDVGWVMDYCRLRFVARAV